MFFNQLRPNWIYLGYQLPPKCFLLELKHAKMSPNTQQLCEVELNLINKLNITYKDKSMSKMTHCEVTLDIHHGNITDICSRQTEGRRRNNNPNFNEEKCKEALSKASECDRWSISEWLFTHKPGVFGLAGGFANITGVLLTIILTVMVICSLPIVRKSGHFQVVSFISLHKPIIKLQ